MNLSTTFDRCYHYSIVQHGSLPLAPDRSYDASIEHRCTSTLIWPEHARPSQKNSLLTDPCFTSQGFHDAVEQLTSLNVSFQEVGWIFVTHPHRDHCSNLANFMEHPPERPFLLNELAGVLCDFYSGHAPMQKGLLFRSISDHIICVTGDAILNLEWLCAWEYYWPNFYHENEIIQTWVSVAKILSSADIIIPGHGHPLVVTVELLEHLIGTFSQAEYASACPDVEQKLRVRFEQLRGQGKK